MHPNVRAWLDVPLLLVDGSRLTRVEHIAELVHVNGGSLTSSSYGFHTMGDGLYGRTGLTHDEANALRGVAGILTGVEMVVPGTIGEVKAEVHKIWRAREAQQAAFTGERRP